MNTEKFCLFVLEGVLPVKAIEIPIKYWKYVSFSQSKTEAPSNATEKDPYVEVSGLLYSAQEE